MQINIMERGDLIALVGGLGSIVLAVIISIYSGVITPR
jgi:hypothetical protein